MTILYLFLCFISINFLFFKFLFQNGSIDTSILEAYLHPKQSHGKGKQNKKLTPEQADTKRRKIWLSIAKKEIPKV